MAGRRGRRRGGSEEGTEVRKPQAELLFPKVERQTHYVEEIKRENKIQADSRARMKKIVKAAEAENVDVKACKDAAKLEKADLAQLRRNMEQYAVLLREHGAPFQLVVWDIAFKNPAEQAEFEGRNAAQAGRGAECRYAEGTQEYEAFMRVYAQVQAGMVPGASKTTTEERSAAIAEGQREKVH